jgi:hypothetical protein
MFFILCSGVSGCIYYEFRPIKIRSPHNKKSMHLLHARSPVPLSLYIVLSDTNTKFPESTSGEVL